MQLLLFPDPRPLVERLGVDFFRQAPECAGVYLMRDAADDVLYVGKAKNLRKRLASYRVANPDRLKRRQLRLLRAVSRIELHECATESTALETEAGLLRELRPRFNRAGTWPAAPQFLGWRIGMEEIELTVASVLQAGWFWYGPFGTSVLLFRQSLVRLLWCVLGGERGWSDLPMGWFYGQQPETARLRSNAGAIEETKQFLQGLFSGRWEEFAAWVKKRTGAKQHPFEIAAREADLDIVSGWIGKRVNGTRIEVEAG